jgi:hypothetical protein
MGELFGAEPVETKTNDEEGDKRPTAVEITETSGSKRV